MKTPAANASTDLWVRVLLYLCASLTRNRSTRDLVALVQPTLDQVDAAEAATTKAERAAVTARAMYDGADMDQDEIVNKFEGELYLHVGKNRKSTLYQKFFPNGLVAVTGAPVPDEVRMIKVIEQTAVRELADCEFVQRLLPQLTAVREEMEHQMQLHQAAMDDLAAAWAKELSARHDARRQYRVVFAELIKRFPENMKKVNSFFKDVGPARKKAEEPEVEEEEGEPEAPAGAGK